MSSTVTKTGLVGAVIAVALLAGVAFAPAAQAQTAAELQAQIQSLLNTISSLQAQIASLGGGSGSGGAGCTFTRDLTIGVQGADVTCLQNYLTGTGHFTFSGGATGYFGPITQSAVAAWQSANNVSPPAGYFGPISRAKYSQLTAGTGTGTGDTTEGDTGTSAATLEGGAGSLSDVDYVSGLNNEEVGEDEADAEVAGLDIEADEGSDIMIVAVNLNFSQGTANKDFDEYADDVSVWLDGEEYARIDARKFEDDDNFDKTITLARGAIIRADQRGDLVVRVSGISNLDSADAGDTWTIEFESVRFEDASGAIITDSSTGVINDGTGRTFSFETFATAADVDLKALISSDTPDSQVVNVDDSNDTDGVELLRFTLEAEGDSEVRVRDIPIEFATSSTNTGSLGDIVNTVYLTIGGTEYSESVSATAGPTITFDDADYTIGAGDKVTVVVSGDVNNVDGSTFVEGDDLLAKFTASNRELMDAEDSTGTDLTSGERSGTATGNALAFYDVGPMVTFVSSSANVQVDDGATNDTGTFTIKYRVEAFDGTIYVSDIAQATTVTDFTTVGSVNMQSDGGVLYHLETGGSATAAGESQSITFVDVTGDPTDTSISNGVEIDDGEVAEFTLTVTRTNTTAIGVAGLYRTLLKAIAWNTSDADATTNVYTFNLEDYKTDNVSLN